MVLQKPVLCLLKYEYIYNCIYINILCLVVINLVNEFFILSSFEPRLELPFLTPVNSDTATGLDLIREM